MMRRLTLAQGQHDLAEQIVHLVGAFWVEFLALEINFGATAVLRQTLGEIEWPGPSDLSPRKMAVHFSLIGWSGLARA